MAEYGVDRGSGASGAGIGGIRHDELIQLLDDDHTQYALLAGRATGQVITGGTASGDDLTLRPTSHATKGDVLLADTGGDVVVGGAATASALKLLEPSASGTNYTALKAQAQSADITYTLPAADAVGTLQSNGSGALSWASIFGVPVGSVLPYAGTTEPTDWLFCYGQAISRTTYAALFTVLSTTYGVGDGSTTFNVPDLRGRAIAGQDDMGGASANRLTNQSGGVEGDTLGASGGAETHALSAAQAGAEHVHALSLTTGTESATHTHTYAASIYSQAGADGGVSSGVTTGASTGTESATHTHSVSGNTTAGAAATAHNNVQPTFIMNFIIRT